ncbi:MAG: amidohydrolase family protein [Vicinamibacterales bacterium]
MSAGLVNAHTHIYSGLVPFGMPPPDDPPRTFVEILERVWWRLDRALDAASLRAAARYYVAEALLAGTTILIDHHESPNYIEGSLDTLAEACETLGMRAVLCYGATERNGGREEARRGLAECRRFIEARRYALVRGVVGLHASFTVSDETIREAARLCRELETVLHVHLAEDQADVDDARRRGYAGPVERLLKFDALPPGSILAHGIYVTESDVRRLEDAGCWVVQNPRSNRTNRVGYPRSLHVSPHIALGTDGFPADMLAERQVLFETGQPHGDRDDVLDRRCVAGFELAARLLDVPFIPPPEHAGEAWMQERANRAITRHVVNGRTVCEDGRLQTGDMDAIRADARREAQRLWARLSRE